MIIIFLILLYFHKSYSQYTIEKYELDKSLKPRITEDRNISVFNYYAVYNALVNDQRKDWKHLIEAQLRRFNKVLEIQQFHLIYLYSVLYGFSLFLRLDYFLHFIIKKRKHF